VVFGEDHNSFDAGQDLFTAYKKQDNEHLLIISNFCCDPRNIATAIMNNKYNNLINKYATKYK
jgi:hypothetical protein